MTSVQRIHTGGTWTRHRPFSKSTPAQTPSNTAMAPNRRKQTARKVIGTSTATKTFAEKEELLKLKRAERAKARRVKAKEDKDTVCSTTMCAGSRSAPGSYGHVHMLIVQGNTAHPKGSTGVHGRGRSGSRGGVHRSGQRGVLPELDNFEKVEEKVGNREISEDDEINLEEICQCEGIPGREPENHTFVSVFLD